MILRKIKFLFGSQLQELNDLLSGVLTSEDEDAVEAEFAEMMALDEGAGDQEDEDIQLPDVPTHKITKPGNGFYYALKIVITTFPINK